MKLHEEHLIYTEVVKGKVISYFMVPNTVTEEIDVWEYYPETSEAENTETFKLDPKLERECEYDNLTFIELYKLFADEMRKECNAGPQTYTLN